MTHKGIGRVSASLVPVLLAACAGGAASPGPAQLAPVSSVSAATFERHVAALAADEFEGRKPATVGEQRTLAYLQAEFRRLGIAPGNGDSFLQTVPIVEITTATDAVLKFSGAAGTQELQYAQDMIAWTKRVAPEIAIDHSPLVFVGHGVVAPEYGWNDYAGVDMRGKTALILINDPGFATGDETLFRGRALTYYGRWTYKFDEAARQGAAGAIIIHETVPAAYGWETVLNSWSGPQLTMSSADGNAGRVEVEGWISNGAAQRLLAAAGRDFAELKVRASQRGFKAFPLGLDASVKLRNAIRTATSANVIGIVPGARRPKEYVVYQAHWDHLGRVMAIGRSAGDTIFNGAVDNATGVAGLLTIAAAVVHAPRRPARSIVFIAPTLEESGLLGSAYYVEHPLFPLRDTVAVLNMDALYFGGPTRDVSVVGYGASELERCLAAAAQRQGRVLKPEPEPEKGAYFRSDQFNFIKQGVPALYIKAGIDDREHGAQWGQKQHDDYLALRYHKPADEYRPGVDLRGALEDLQLFYDVGMRLAAERSFPNWYAGSEFRATRDRSRATC